MTASYLAREIESYHKDLAHMIIEPDKFQDLQSTRWRHSRADGVVLVWMPGGSRPWKSQCFSWSLQSGKKPCPSSRQSGRASSLLLTQGSPFLSSLGLQLIEWGPPTWGPSTLFSLLIQMLIWSRNTITGTPRIIFDQMSRCSVAQSSWNIKSATTHF